jgi:hypothetical protein
VSCAAESCSIDDLPSEADFLWVVLTDRDSEQQFCAGNTISA